MSARSSFPFCTHQCSQLPQIVNAYSSLSLFPLFRGVQILCPVSSYTMQQHIPWPWWWWTIIIFHDEFVLRPQCFTSFTVHIWFLQNVYTPNKCIVLHNTFFIGNWTLIGTKGEGRPCWHLCNLFPLWFRVSSVINLGGEPMLNYVRVY